MKRIIISLTCIILFFSLCVFAACADSYKVPQDCCIISLPSGFELWTEDADTFEKIEKNLVTYFSTDKMLSGYGKMREQINAGVCFSG